MDAHEDAENLSSSFYRADLSSNAAPLKKRKAFSPLNSIAIWNEPVTKEDYNGSRNIPPSKSRAIDRPPMSLSSKTATDSKIHNNISTNCRPYEHSSNQLNTIKPIVEHCMGDRRRSSSTSSIQRLAHSFSDDQSVASVRTISSNRSLRSTSTARTVISSTTSTNNSKDARGRSKDVVDRRIRSRSNYETIPNGRGNGNRSTSTYENLIPEKLTPSNNYATRSMINNPSKDSSSWLDEQRKIKEDRKMRSRKKPVESVAGEVFINELNQSLQRIQQEYAVSTTHGDEITKETPVKRPAGSLSNRIANGFHSPFKSPTISNFESPVTYSKISATLQANSTLNLSKIQDGSTTNILADISGFDPHVSQVKNLSEAIFGSASGISDEDIRKVLSMKSSKTNKWELKKQLDEANNCLGILKDTMTALHRGKNKFVFGAMEAEKNARNGWGRALKCATVLDEEKIALKERIKELESHHTKAHESSNDLKNVVSEKTEKVQALEDELGKYKAKIDEYENEHIRSSVALEIERARNNDMIKQLEAWRADISVIEVSKMEAIKEAESNVASILEEDKKALSLRLEEKQLETDQYKIKVHELEAQLLFKDKELLRTRIDLENITNRANAKENDLTDLMKTIGDIQATGRMREEEATKMKNEAEKKLMDIKSEFSILAHDKTILKDALDEIKIELLEAEKQNNELRAEIERINQDIGSQSSTLQLERELRSRSEQKEREERNERIALSAQMFAMAKEHSHLEACLKQSQELELFKLKEIILGKENELNERKKELVLSQEKNAGLDAEIKSLIESINQQKSLADAKCAEEISHLRGQINLLSERLRSEEKKNLSVGLANAEHVNDLQSQIQILNTERRRMHNLIQELRGNVRVFARIRPFLPDDNVNEDSLGPILANGENTIKVIMPDDRQKYDFNFDRVFSPAIGQEAIFTEVSEFVQSALDGYNVCLFSYGQTGSGKTYTMQGFGTGQMRGIIPRAIEQVGNYKQQLEKDGWQYDMQVSFLEIYNESIRDLLREEGSELLKHDIKVDAEGRRFVSDLTMVPLEPTDKDAVEAVMRQAAKHRAVGSTDMNATSSRSHSVFTLHLTAFHPTQRQALRGTLNLVDLAGSERLSRSNVSGERAKEAVAINKSLSALTDVFVAIGQKASHIPFRNSKLTYLLQPSFSGDGKTLMMVNLSPTEMSAQESLCSLRFAAQVNKCELGKAKSSVEYLSEDDGTTSHVGTPGKKRCAAPNGSSVPRNVKARSNK